MKTKRLVALLCALLMVLSVASLASAESDKYFGYDGEYYTLGKGKTASFFLLPYSHSLYTANGTYYSDVIYDCEGPVSATVNSGKNWITVTNTMSSFIVTFSPNYTQKARTGKITVNGSGYKATMKFTQYGIDKILSFKRSNKNITLKFKLASGTKTHYMYINDEARKVEDGMTWYSYVNDIYEGKFAKTSYKFKAQKNHYYWVGVGPAFAHKSGSNTYYNYSTTSWAGMYVTELTGTQNADYIDSDGN